MATEAFVTRGCMEPGDHGENKAKQGSVDLIILKYSYCIRNKGTQRHGMSFENPQLPKKKRNRFRCVS